MVLESDSDLAAFVEAMKALRSSGASMSVEATSASSDEETTSAKADSKPASQNKRSTSTGTKSNATSGKGKTEPKPEPEESGDDEVTIDMLRTKLAALTKAGVSIKPFLKKYNADKLSTVDESDYKDLWKDLQNENAGESEEE